MPFRKFRYISQSLDKKKVVGGWDRTHLNILAVYPAPCNTPQVQFLSSGYWPAASAHGGSPRKGAYHMGNGHTGSKSLLPAPYDRF